MKQKILELAKKYGPIRIRCEARDSLPLDIILDFQGKLKKGSKENVLKLIERIFKLGFIAPFFVWENGGDYYNLDGHRRVEALCAIREAGVEIPGVFPVAYIKADSEKEAKEIILSVSSQYGSYDVEALSDWINDIGKDVADSLRLVDEEINFSLESSEPLLSVLSVSLSDDQYKKAMKRLKAVKQEKGFSRLGEALFHIINNEEPY